MSFLSFLSHQQPTSTPSRSPSANPSQVPTSSPSSNPSQTPTGAPSKEVSFCCCCCLSESSLSLDLRMPLSLDLRMPYHHSRHLKHRLTLFVSSLFTSDLSHSRLRLQANLLQGARAKCRLHRRHHRFVSFPSLCYSASSLVRYHISSFTHHI